MVGAPVLVSLWTTSGHWHFLYNHILKIIFETGWYLHLTAPRTLSVFAGLGASTSPVVEVTEKQSWWGSWNNQMLKQKMMGLLKVSMKAGCRKGEKWGHRKRWYSREPAWWEALAISRIQSCGQRGRNNRRKEETARGHQLQMLD